MVTREENWVEWGGLGRVAYLKANEDEIIDRLSASKKRRPLLEVEDWQSRLRSLLAEREPLYQKADVVVELMGEGIEGAAKRAYEAFMGAVQ